MDFWTCDGSLGIRYKQVHPGLPAGTVEECDIKPKGIFTDGKRITVSRQVFTGKREFSCPTRDGLSVQTIRAQEVQIWYTGEHYWTRIWLDEDGQPVCTKIEFCLPVEINGNIATHVTLELGIFVSFDGWSRIVDEDKYLQLIGSGLINPRQADKIREACLRMVNEIEDEHYPTDILRGIERLGGGLPECVTPNWSESECQCQAGPSITMDQVTYRWGVSGRAHQEMAKELFIKGDYKAAESMYRRAIALEPSNCGYRFALGCLYLNQDRLEDAQAQFVMALTSKREALPSYLAWSHVNLADILMSKGKTAEAEDHYRQALSFDKAGPAMQAYRGLGKIAMTSRGKRQLYNFAAARLGVVVQEASEPPKEAQPVKNPGSNKTAASADVPQGYREQVRRLIYMLPQSAGYRCVIEEADSDSLTEVMLQA